METTIFDMVFGLLSDKEVKIKKPIYQDGRVTDYAIFTGLVTDIILESDTYHTHYIIVRLDNDFNKEISLEPDTKLIILK